MTLDPSAEILSLKQFCSLQSFLHILMSIDIEFVMNDSPSVFGMSFFDVDEDEIDQIDVLLDDPR